jgi:alkylhydroperoxidase family enzyme
VSGEDIQRLRDAGLDDEGISSATQVIAYFNYINRIAEGLGVPMEAWLNDDGTPKRA